MPFRDDPFDPNRALAALTFSVPSLREAELSRIPVIRIR